MNIIYNINFMCNKIFYNYNVSFFPVIIDLNLLADWYTSVKCDASCIYKKTYPSFTKPDTYGGW